MDPRNSLVDQYVWDVKPIVRRKLSAYGLAQVKRRCGGSCHKRVREKTRTVWTHAIVDQYGWDVQLWLLALGLVKHAAFCCKASCHKRLREKTRKVWTHAIVLLTSLCGMGNPWLQMCWAWFKHAAAQLRRILPSVRAREDA